ncbi:hypothetical protein J5N97_028332 [Dioscorea zingiberensis]|uniref:Uncharacterized protein n=1 Tax=Dioscorea zingiberensis TaxID=325984 RepID=A0A9D5H4R6_9LILI|nr:hypothetical protein J5N97_028332 [Dioscorea zingiberensis]
MPGLQSLCLSPAYMLSGNNGNIKVTTAPCLPTKATTLSFSKRENQHSQNIDDHLPLPLPDLPTHVKEKILFLELMGVDSGRVLALNPDLRNASPDCINSIVSFLLARGIHHKDLSRIFGMCPKVLTSSITSDLIPVFRFLSGDLHVPESNFRKVINKCPRLLVSSVKDQLKPALLYLQRLGFTDGESLAYSDAILLVSSVEKTLIPKLQYLISLGLTREEAVGMVLRCPGLFTFSIENNFKPKYEYFIKEMGGTLEELKEFPQYFAFSLEKRIKPRHQELRRFGVSFPLPDMLKSTDEEFKAMIHNK